MFYFRYNISLVILGSGHGRYEEIQRNVEQFVTELGIRINKLQVMRNDDYTEIKPKVWLDKKNWREINEILVKYGFVWKSCNIDSCWIKNRE